MKAEHRKELETNALADRMGRVVRTIKQRPQKRTMVWVLLAVVAVAVVLLFYRRSHLRTERNAEDWFKIADGAGPYITELIEREPDSNQAKAAQFQVRYMLLRQALSVLATAPKQALSAMDDIDRAYGELSRLCKDDKVLLPEALFAQAVIEETRIIKDDDNWKNALTKYKDVADNHPNTAFGKLAAKRVEILENKDKRDELLNIYRDLRIEFVREDRLPVAPPGVLPPEHPPIPPAPPIIPPPPPEPPADPK